MNDIAWNEEGVTSLKLEWIALTFGLFFKAHRALQDCQAVLELLSLPLPVSGRTGFTQFLEAARRPTKRLWAVNAPLRAERCPEALWVPLERRRGRAAEGLVPRCFGGACGG